MKLSPRRRNARKRIVIMRGLLQLTAVLVLATPAFAFYSPAGIVKTHHHRLAPQPRFTASPKALADTSRNKVPILGAVSYSCVAFLAGAATSKAVRSALPVALSPTFFAGSARSWAANSKLPGWEWIQGRSSSFLGPSPGP